MNTATSSIVDAGRVMWADIAAFAPRFVLFLVIIVVGYFVAKWIARLVEIVLNRLGLDKAIEKGGLNRAMANAPYHATEILRKIVFFALFLMVLQLALGPFGPNPVSDILTRLIAFLPALFVALLIVVIAAAVATMVKGIVSSVLSRMRYGPAVGSGAGAAVMTVGIFAALSHLGVAPAVVNGLFYALLAVVAGSAIVAIGGGGIMPMRRQWEKAVDRIEVESRRGEAPGPEVEAQAVEAGQETEASPRFSAERGQSGRYQPKERSRPE